MSADDARPPAAAVPSRVETGLAIVAIVLLVGGYFGLCWLLGLRSAWGGLLFSLYWGGLREGRASDFLPTLTGALGGVLTAWALHDWPVLLGPAGLAAAMALVVIAVYALLRGAAPMLANLAFMTFVTVATIPAVAAAGHHALILASIVLGAGYFGGSSLIGSALRRRGTAGRADAPQALP